MNTMTIIAALDAEIARLQRVHSLLSQSGTVMKGMGRPPGSRNVQPRQAAGMKPKKRILSAEGKERIAAAQKRRWAKLKKSASAKAKSKPIDPKITKVPAKVARAKRSAKPKLKATTALSGKVQEGAVAAPAKGEKSE